MWPAALAEAVRVLKPGGQVRFLEHVRADTSGLARVQDVLDATLWPRLLGGCHTGVYVLPAVVTTVRRTRKGRTNAQIAFQAITALRDQLPALVAAHRSSATRPAAGVGPFAPQPGDRTGGGLRRVLWTLKGHRPQPARARPARRRNRRGIPIRTRGRRAGGAPATAQAPGVAGPRVVSTRGPSTGSIRRMTDRAALVDIDGVLADMSPFSSLVTGEDRQWREFFEHLGEATPIPAGVALVRALFETDIKVRYSTTRPRWTREATYAWLAAHGLPDCFVYTRDPDEDRRRGSRPSPLWVKRAHIKILGKQRPGRRLVAWIDDEPEIVAELRRLQVPAYLHGDLTALTPEQLAGLDVPQPVPT